LKAIHFDLELHKLGVTKPASEGTVLDALRKELEDLRREVKKLQAERK